MILSPIDIRCPQCGAAQQSECRDLDDDADDHTVVGMSSGWSVHNRRIVAAQAEPDVIEQIARWLEREELWTDGIWNAARRQHLAFMIRRGDGAWRSK